MTVACDTDLPPAFDGIEAVCFDAFGTLVEITDKRGAFVPLFRVLPPDKRRELKHRLMREERSVSGWLDLYQTQIDPVTALRVHAMVLVEVHSIAMRPGMAGIWTRLRDRGLRLALCSNLAASYGIMVRLILPDPPDVAVLSYEVGAIKPEPAICAHVLDGLKLDPQRVLFVGDTPRADIEGPRAMGMRALHVRDFETAMKNSTVFR